MLRGGINIKSLLLYLVLIVLIRWIVINTYINNEPFVPRGLEIQKDISETKEQTILKFNKERRDKVKKLEIKLQLKFERIFPKTEIPLNYSTQKIPLTVIMSRMRSGSTFLGDLFKASPGSFFLFEPMQYVSRTVGVGEILYLNGTVRNYSLADIPEVQAQMMRNWLTCNLKDIDYETFKVSHFMYHTNHAQIYSCQRRVKGERSAILKKCLPWLQSQCERATSRTLKVITADMQAIKILFEYIPGIRVIHLVRDPRAVMRSQLSVGQVKKENIESESEKHCSDVVKSLSVCATLGSHRNKLMIQRYEDLAAEPLQQLQNMYKFCGLKLNNNVKSVLSAIALRKGRVNSCTWCSNKGDAHAASLKWRSSMPYDTMLKVQSQCLGMMQSVGYIEVNSKTKLINVSFSLVKKKQL